MTLWKAIQNFIHEHNWQVELVLGFLLMATSTNYLVFFTGFMVTAMGIWTYSERNRK